jgi:hypothetical protein
METINLTRLSSLIAQRINCVNSNNQTQIDAIDEELESIFKALPSGSGLDKGVNFDLKGSKPEKLIFTFEYHHMNDGYYSGWTSHTMVLTPAFGDYSIDIKGQNKNQIKDYLYDIFSTLFVVTSREIAIRERHDYWDRCHRNTSKLTSSN